MCKSKMGFSVVNIRINVWIADTKEIWRRKEVVRLPLLPADAFVEEEKPTLTAALLTRLF